MHCWRGCAQTEPHGGQTTVTVYCTLHAERYCGSHRALRGHQDTDSAAAPVAKAFSRRWTSNEIGLRECVWSRWFQTQLTTTDFCRMFLFPGILPVLCRYSLCRGVALRLTFPHSSYLRLFNALEKVIEIIGVSWLLSVWC